MATLKRALLSEKPPAACENYKNPHTMTNDKEEQTKKMMSEEYGKSLTGCFTIVVVIVLALLGVGILVCLTTI